VFRESNVLILLLLLVTHNPIILMSVALYSMASYYFLRHPEHLHGRSISSEHLCMKVHPLTIFGHRSGGGEFLENTLGAYLAVDKLREKYSKEGVTVAIETDSRMSKDGVVFTVHDATFKRASGVDKKVSETDSNDFPLIKEGKIPVEFGGFYEATKSDDRTYCTLETLY